MEEDADIRLCYRQRKERSSGGEITLMKWSPTMDVIALAFSDNSVALNRLSWQRVWTLDPTDTLVSGFAWRPDGKVLAVGYGNGKVVLCDVRDARCLHSISIAPAAVCSLSWVEDSTERESAQYKDLSDELLPLLPALDTSLGNLVKEEGSCWVVTVPHRESCYPSDPKEIQTLSNAVSGLWLGSSDGRVHLCVCGLFHAIAFPAGGNDNEVIHLCPAPDLSCLAAIEKVTKDGVPSYVTLRTLDTGILNKRSSEFHHVALKYTKICSLVEYIGETLQSMNEGWEDSLLKVDRKLAAYSENLPSGLTIADELIILLGCGKSRPELQSFLKNDLTAQGVKKLGLSLEMSYNSLRKLVIYHLESATQSLNFHLYDILGFSKWEEAFGFVGLSHAEIEDCIHCLGTFALKAQELLFVIDNSLQNLKVFFLWLYKVILKLSGEKFPPGLTESLTADELRIIKEFLSQRRKNGDHGHGRHKLNLEVVGQYLANNDLEIVEERSDTTWEKILSSANLTTKDTKILLRPASDKSLVQLFHMLKKKLEDMFTSPQLMLQRHVSCQYTFHLPIPIQEEYKDESWSRSAIFFHKNDYFLYQPCAGGGGLIVHQSMDDGFVRCGRVIVRLVPQLPDVSSIRTSILCLQYYDPEALSVICHYSSSSDCQEAVGSESCLLAQLPMEAFTSAAMESVSGGSLTAELMDRLPVTDLGPSLAQLLKLDQFPSQLFTVSGPRRLVAVVAKGSRRVKLFDVDAEEEDSGDEG